MVSRNGRFGKYVPLIHLDPLDFCPNSLYPQARQALPRQQEFHCCLLRYGMATSQSGAPKGRSVQSSRPRFPKKNKSLHRTKHFRNAAQARVEPPKGETFIT